MPRNKCCCGCTLFQDLYDNRTDNLADDGVNVIDGTRYSFPASSWHVDTGTGKLVCDTGGALLKFYDSGARLNNVAVDGTLTAIGDYFEICFDTHNVKVEGYDATTLRYSSEGLHADVTIGSYPQSVTLHAEFFRQSAFPDFFAQISPTPDADVWRFTGPFSDCPLVHFDLSTGFTTWGLKASAGMVLDNLVVTRPIADCDSIDVSCASVCWDGPPSSMSITVSGLESDWVWCGPVSEVGDCNTDYYDCVAACTDCDCECACWAAWSGCLCDRVYSLGECVKYCPCGDLNGEFVMEPVACGCDYSYCFHVYEADISNLDGLCSPTIDHYSCYGASLAYMGDGLVEITLGVPWSHATVGWWTTGIINASEICSGGTVELTPNTGPTTVYADEVQFGCGCGSNHDFVCGIPGEGGCSSDPYVTCGDYSENVHCDSATHTAISISDLTVTP